MKVKISGVDSLQTTLDAKALAGAIASSGLTITTATLVGRTTAGSGAVEELSATAAKTMLALENVENKSSATIRGEISSSNVTTALGYTPVDSAKLGAANGVATLGADSKIPSAQLPALAITTVQTANSDAAQLALTTQEGDVVIRSDVSKTFIRNAGTAGTMADFSEITTPLDGVQSVNGKSGSSVTLVAGDIGYTAGGGIVATTVQAAISELDTDKANASHTHAIADVTGLQTALDNKLDDSQAATFGLSVLGSSTAAAGTALFNNVVGTDGATAGTKGLVPAPATTDLNKYLKGDGTWASLPAGVTTFQELTDAADYVVGDANKVVKVNSSGNGLDYGAVLGTAASQNTGTSGANVPLLNGTNTWSGGQTMSNGLDVTGQITRDGVALVGWVKHIASYATTADLGSSTSTATTITGYDDTGTVTGDLTSASTTVSNVSAADIAKLKVGATVTGANIPASTTIASIAANSFVMSNAATATAAATAITYTQTIAALSVDGASPSTGTRILVKNETSAARNGIYTVTATGSTTEPWVLTRAEDANTAPELANAQVAVDLGTANGGTIWRTPFLSTGTIGTTAINWHNPNGLVTASGLTMSSARILGRTTGSTGAVEEITVGTGLTLSSGVLASAPGGWGATVTATGTGASQNITLPESGLDPADVLVFVNGVRFNSNEYTISGTTLTMTSNASGDSIEIVKPTGATGATGSTYRIAGFKTTSPAANEVLVDHIVTDAFVFNGNLVGSQASVGTNPAATFTMTVQKNGTGVGTIVVSTTGSVSFTTTSGATVSVNAGDVISVLAPGTTDANIARIRFTLRSS